MNKNSIKEEKPIEESYLIKDNKFDFEFTIVNKKPKKKKRILDDEYD